MMMDIKSVQQSTIPPYPSSEIATTDENRPLSKSKLLLLITGLAALLSITSLGFGAYSFIHSDWLGTEFQYNGTTVRLDPYKLCEEYIKTIPPAKLEYKASKGGVRKTFCPPVELDVYFLVAVIICAFLSCILLLINLVSYCKEGIAQWTQIKINYSVNAIVLVIILAAGIVFSISISEQKRLEPIFLNKLFENYGRDYKGLYLVKLFAVIFAFLQLLLHAFTSSVFHIVRRSWLQEQESLKVVMTTNGHNISTIQVPQAAFIQAPQSFTQTSFIQPQPQTTFVQTSQRFPQATLVPGSKPF